jgi:RES domain-containing protein
LKAYRFVSTGFPDGLSCDGARLNGGRWNSKGVPVLYCARTESLAMLELRVHAPQPYPRERLRFVIEVPDDAVHEAPLTSLPRGWNKLPPSPASKRFGDEWIAGGSSLGLLVPSVIASEERDLLLNPAHARFSEVRVLKKSRVQMDMRLYEQAHR